MQKKSDRLTEFLNTYASSAFEAFMTAEAGPTRSDCSACSAKCAGDHSDDLYRCRRCLHTPQYCKTCLMSSHKHELHHGMERWDKGRKIWISTNLGELGAAIYLGHGGERCPSIIPRMRDMTIMHEGGVHRFSVRFCSCHSPKKDHEQLLEARLWPASWGLPQTAFSFGVMEQFQLLSVKCTISAHDFFAYLASTTDSEFPADVTVCFHLYFRAHPLRGLHY